MMNAIKNVAINGFGRIGKMVFRQLCEDETLNIVAINDPMPIDKLLYLLKYDTVHGLFKYPFEAIENTLLINNKEIKITNKTDPSQINWNDSAVDLVIESSGKFKTANQLGCHINNGAKKVILSAPTDDEDIKMFVYGYNENNISPKDIIISNASCTTNCVVHMLNILSTEFDIETAFMNTVHPYTNNQSIIDSPHEDLRRSRAAADNIIPTTSTAVKAIHRLMPELKEKFDGFATRVPVINGSLIELSCVLNKPTSMAMINNVFKKYSAQKLKNILEYSSDPLVSSDIKGNKHSCIFDSLSTKVLNNKYIQIVAWYDNEIGYSTRIVDLINHLNSIN